MFQGKEYVYEVYKEKSFSKAAQNLFISQPSLSANVARVEKRVGQPLFDRSSKPLKLTKCGEQYIQAVEEIMNIEQDFENYLNDSGELRTGRLVLGGSNLFSSWILPPLMAEFGRMYPGIELILIEENTAHLSELLQEGKVDLLVDNSILNPTLFDRRIFRKETLLLAVPADFAINQELEDYVITPEVARSGGLQWDQHPALPLEKLAGEPFIFMKPENDTAKRARAICEEQKISPKILFEVDQQMTAFNITCSGIGISFIGNTLIANAPSSKKVRYYKLAGDNCRRNIYFYWRRGRYMGRVAEEFLNLFAGNT